MPAPPAPAAGAPARARPAWRRRLKNGLLYYLICGAVRLLARLPLPLVDLSGRALGGAAFWLGRRERARALHNLQRVWPHLDPGQRRRLARAAFSHLGRSALECVTLPRLWARRPALVAFAPGALSQLQAAVAQGRGVLFITAHLGNWELLGAAVARHVPTSVLYKPSYDPRLSKLIHGFRQRSGISGIDVTRPGHVLAVLRALRRGELVGVLQDQPTPQGQPCTLLGQPACLSPLAAQVARRSGAVVLAGFIRREGRLRHEIDLRRLDPPVTCEACVDAVGQAITAHPAQWVWSLDSWRAEVRG